MNYGDFPIEETIHVFFTTRAFATGIPGTLSAATVAVYEDITATPIETSIAVTESLNSIAGLNAVPIVAIAASGYEVGKNYHVVIEAGTVDSVSVVGEVVAYFSIGRSAAAVDLANGTDGLGALKTDTSAIIDLVNGLGGSTGGSVSIQTILDNTVTDTTDAAAAVDKGTSPETVGVPVTGHAFVAGQEVTLAGTTNYNGSFDVDSVTTDEVVIVATFTAETFGGSDTIVSSVKGVSFVGSVQSGTVASTEALDGILHDIDDDGNDDIDLIYTFNVGAGRTATEIIFHGFVQGNGDTIDIEVYDHVGNAWEILRTITGANGTNNITLEVPLLLKHTGTSGLDTGRTYVRYDTNATTPSNLSTDQLLVEAINTGNLNAYDNGQIWINTNASNTNTVADVDGTTRRPVSTIAAAKSLSTKTGLGDFHVINGSSFTLAESTVNESYFGDNWTLALGGQDVAEAYFQGAHISGVGTSATEVHYEGCDVATMSVQIGHFDFCSFDGTVTHTLAGDYNYHNCYSKVAGAGGPTFTKTAGQTITAQWRNWSGSITVSGIQASDVMTISGTELGDVVLNGADGTVKILGIYESLTDNRTGAPTLIEGAFEGSDVTDILADTGTDGVIIAPAQGPVTFTGASDEAGLTLVGEGTGPGLSATGGATGHGFEAIGGATSGDGINAAADASGRGMCMTGVGANAGLRTEGGATGPGIHAHGGATGATPGVEFHAHSATGDALELEVDGSGDTNADLVAILEDTTEIGTAGAGLTNINLPNQTMNITGSLSGAVGSVTGAVGSVSGNVDGSVGSVTGAVGSVTGAVGSVAGNVDGSVGSVTGAVGSVAGNVDGNVTGSVGSLAAQAVTDVLTTQMTESYASNGTAPTLAQFAFAVHQMLMQFGIASTSLTVRKLNNTTTAFVVTLDDDTNPTDAKRV